MALSVKGATGLLVRIPTALFPVALGLSGLGALCSVLANKASLEHLSSIGHFILILAGIVLVLDIVGYLIKFLTDRNAVAEDLATATRANLLAPGFMAAMVIGGSLTTLYPIAGIIWMIASAGHSILLINFVGRWLTHDYAPEDLNPTWFLPAAGIMTSSMTWPGIGPSMLPLMLFGIGSVLWIMLLPLVFRRLVFEPPVLPELRPTLFIIAAPFGLFSGSILTLFPHMETPITLVSLSAGAFFVLVLITQSPFLRRAGVTLSWWAATFPVATIASGFIRLSLQDTSTSIPLIAGVLLALVSVVTSAIAIIATFRAAGRTCWRTIEGTKREISAMHGIDPQHLDDPKPIRDNQSSF